MTNKTISEAQMPQARSTGFQSLVRIGRYMLLRGLTIGIAVVIGVLLNP